MSLFDQFLGKIFGKTADHSGSSRPLAIKEIWTYCGGERGGSLLTDCYLDAAGELVRLSDLMRPEQGSLKESDLAE